MKKYVALSVVLASALFVSLPSFGGEADASAQLKIEGEVHDLKTPLADTIVSFTNQEGQITTVETGADGKYQIPPLAPGKYVISFSKDGYKPYQTQQTLTADVPYHLHMGMIPLKQQQQQQQDQQPSAQDLSRHH